MKRIKNWIRRKLLSFLGFYDYEFFMGVDVHVKGPTEIMLVKYHKRTGEIECIRERKTEMKHFDQFCEDIRDMARAYNIERKNMVVDDFIPPVLRRCDIGFRNNKYLDK